jgi:hypothetical protein
MGPGSVAVKISGGKNTFFFDIFCNVFAVARHEKVSSLTSHA